MSHCFIVHKVPSIYRDNRMMRPMNVRDPQPDSITSILFRLVREAVVSVRLSFSPHTEKAENWIQKERNSIGSSCKACWRTYWNVMKPLWP